MKLQIKALKGKLKPLKGMFKVLPTECRNNAKNTGVIIGLIAIGVEW
jgi:hypothetical protein